MKRFILSLPDDLAEQIESYRVSHGLKSTAAAHRELLAAGLKINRDLVGLEFFHYTTQSHQAAAPVISRRAMTNMAQTVALGGGAPALLETFGPVKPKPGALLKKR